MKKLLIIVAAVLVTDNLFATDQTVTESFSQVPAFTMVNDRIFIQGDLLEWAIRYGRRKADEKIGEEQATYLQAQSNYGYLEMNEDFEGGIKNIAFNWGHGNENDYTVVLRMFVRGANSWGSTVQTWSNTPSDTKAWQEHISYDLQLKKNSRIKFDNLSVKTEGVTQPTEAKGRVLIGDITITPYLRYTTKYVTIDDVATYTNNDLINNTDEGSIVYSLENNDDNIASINSSTGEVTVLKSGIVTVKATWGEVVTTYQLKMYKYSTEGFAGVQDSDLKYYNNSPTAISTGQCTWTCMLAGVNKDFGKFGVDNKAIGIKAPYTGSSETAYIQTSTMDGGLSKLVFKWNLNGEEANTTWDIRFLVNGRLVKTLTNAELPTTQQSEPGTITIDNINQTGNYILRIENHSTVPDYTKDNKARFVMDDFEFYGYYSECGTCFPVNFP